MNEIPEDFIFDGLADQVHLKAVCSVTDAHKIPNSAMNRDWNAAAQVNDLSKLGGVYPTQVKALGNTLHESAADHPMPDGTDKAEKEGA